MTPGRAGLSVRWDPGCRTCLCDVPAGWRLSASWHSGVLKPWDTRDDLRYWEERDGGIKGKGVSYRRDSFWTGFAGEEASWKNHIKMQDGKHFTAYSHLPFQVADALHTLPHLPFHLADYHSALKEVASPNQRGNWVSNSVHIILLPLWTVVHVGLGGDYFSWIYHTGLASSLFPLCLPRHQVPSIMPTPSKCLPVSSILYMCNTLVVCLCPPWCWEGSCDSGKHFEAWRLGNHWPGGTFKGSLARVVLGHEIPG